MSNDEAEHPGANSYNKKKEGLVAFAMVEPPRWLIGCFRSFPHFWPGIPTGTFPREKGKGFSWWPGALELRFFHAPDMVGETHLLILGAPQQLSIQTAEFPRASHSGVSRTAPWAWRLNPTSFSTAVKHFRVDVRINERVQKMHLVESHTH